MTQKFEMADRFNPSAVEQALYQHWEESGYFKPSENENAPSYCIAIPPPNVTGSLHMGHADVYKRQICSLSVCWK